MKVAKSKHLTGVLHWKNIVMYGIIVIAKTREYCGIIVSRTLVQSMRVLADLRS